MEIITQFVNTLLEFESYLLLPIIMFILCLIIKVPINKAFKHCITLGIGFIGIFMTFDYFVLKLMPVLNCIIERTGMEKNVLDVGWPPLAAMAWKFKIAPVLIFVFLIINILMISLKLTQTINIDIWNYWHFILTAQIVYTLKGNMFMAIGAGVAIFLICQKIADWSCRDVEEYAHMPRIAITTLSALAYYPSALVINQVLSKIPGIKDIKGETKQIQKKIGILGEPMCIGFVIGICLGIAANYDVKGMLELAINIAAVVYILPKMSGILGEGLIPICDQMKQYMICKFPKMKDTYVGMDLAILMGDPAIIVTGILFIPITVVLALVLPGIRVIPIGDLPNMISYATLIVVACRGNIFRGFIAGIPTIIAKLYIASYMAPTYTQIAAQTNTYVGGYEGEITGFLDGGNILRYWIAQLFEGEKIGLILSPLAVLLIYYTYRHANNKKVA